MTLFWPVKDLFQINSFDDIIKIFPMHKAKICDLIRTGKIDLNEQWGTKKQTNLLDKRLKLANDNKIFEMIEHNVISFSNLEDVLDSIVEIDEDLWFTINYRGEHDDQDDLMLHQVDMDKLLEACTVKEVIKAEQRNNNRESDQVGLSASPSTTEPARAPDQGVVNTGNKNSRAPTP